MKEMGVFNLYVCVTCVCFVSYVASLDAIQKERLCVDPECSVPISYARSELKYSSPMEGVLSFKANQPMTIYSKVTSEDAKLKRGFWGAEINGKRGYVPPNLIREFKVLSRDVNFVVPTAADKKVDIESSQKEPPAQQVTGGVAAELGDGGPPPTPFTVVEGTTVYIGVDGEKVIEPSATQDATMKTDTVETNADGRGPMDSNEIEKEGLEANTGKNFSDSNSTAGDDEDDNDSDEDSDDGDEDDEEEVEDESEETETKESLLVAITNEVEAKEESVKSPQVVIPVVTDGKVPVESGGKSVEVSSSTTVNHETQKQPAIINAPPIETTPPVVTPSPVAVPVSQPLSSADVVETEASVEYVTQSTSSSAEAVTEHIVSSVDDSEILSPPDNVSETLTVEQSTPDPFEQNVEALQTESSTVSTHSTESTFGYELNLEVLQPESSSISPQSIETTSTEQKEAVKPEISTVSPEATDTAPDTDQNVLPESSTVLPYTAETAGSSVHNVEADAIPKRPPSFGAIPPLYPRLFPSQPSVVPQDPVLIEKVPQDVVPSVVTEVLNDTPTVHVISQDVLPKPTSTSDGSSLPIESIEVTVTTQEDIGFQGVVEEVTVESIPTLPDPSSTNLVEEIHEGSDSKQQEVTSVPSGSKEIDGRLSLPLQEEPVISSDSGDVKDGESAGFLGGLIGVFSGLFGSDTADPTVGQSVPEEAIVPPEEPAIESANDSVIADEAEPVKIVPEGQCKSLEGLESDCEDAPSPSYLFEFFEKQTSKSTAHTFLYLLITAVTVLVFTLGHYFIERSRQDGPLIAKVNQLTRELQVATAQLESRSFKESNSLAEINNEVLVALQAEVDDLKRIKAEQEAQLEALQQELDSVTEAGLDLNRMLSDLLTQKHGSDNILLSVEQLQGQLNSQQRVIDEMNRNLSEKDAENEALQVDLATALEKAESLEEEISEMRQNLNMHLKEKEEVTQLLEGQNAKLQADLATAVKSKGTEVAALTKAAKELTERLAIRDSEFKALTETIEQLKQKGVDKKALYDVGHVKAELARVQQERDTLQERLSDEEGARKLLEDHVKAVDEEVTRLRGTSEVAEREKVEAETRLNVLSNYFKEKETQLQKELGLQEAMWVQKQGDETTIFQRVKALQEEVDNYKSENGTLLKEILDQERGLKGQIATLEKKAHENWVAARQAERRLEESKQEAGQLRNMLTLMEKSQVSEVDAKAPGRLPTELNGELPPLLADGTSPLPFPPPPLPLDPLSPHPPMLLPGFMPPPPFMPPGGFIPPPPFLPPSMPGDRRPAPLGRMSSPPLNRFSPGPGYDDYDRMSPPPLSPPVRNYRSNEGDRFRRRTPPSPSFPGRQWDEPPHRAGFRPVVSQRDSRRDYEDSNVSSGHSSNDSLDKPSRMQV